MFWYLHSSAKVFQKLFRRQPSLFQDVGEGGSLHRPVSGNGQLENLIWQVLLKPYVASLLANHNPPRTLQSCDDNPGTEPWSYQQFPHLNALLTGQVVINRLEVELGGFSNIGHCLFCGITLADAARKRRDIDSEAPLRARLQYDP